jgi:hypothetical protein
MQFRKKPNEYRFALGVAVAGIALLLAFVLRWLEDTVSCAPAARSLRCYDPPPMAYELLFVVAGLGLCHSVYRYYRDFVRGEYEQRCARRGY